jgi:hypothetical protein
MPLRLVAAGFQPPHARGQSHRIGEHGQVQALSTRLAGNQARRPVPEPDLLIFQWGSLQSSRPISRKLHRFVGKVDGRDFALPP